MEWIDKLSILFQNANLKIHDFDIHERKSMNTRNRELPYYVLSYIKQGSSKVHLQGEDYYARERDAIILPPNQVHDHIMDTDVLTIFMWWHFTFSLTDSIDILKMFDLPVIFKIPNYMQFENVFSTYMSLAKNPRTIQEIILRRAKRLELLAMIIEAIAENMGSNPLKSNYSTDFTRILIEIVQNPEKDLKLEELGKKYHLHPTYISNRFKILFGVSPIQLRNKLRIDKAKTLLRSRNSQVNKIASIVGYKNSDHFTNYFKQQTGMSPSRFRESHYEGN